MGGEQEERDEGEDEKKRSNLLWLSWTDRRFASDSRCVRKERKGKKNTKKKNTRQLSLLQMFFDVSKVRKLRLMVCLHFPGGVCTAAWFVQL